MAAGLFGGNYSVRTIDRSIPDLSENHNRIYWMQAAVLNDRRPDHLSISHISRDFQSKVVRALPCLQSFIYVIFNDEVDIYGPQRDWKDWAQ